MNAPTPVAIVAPYQRHVAALENVPEAIRDMPIWCAWVLEHNGKPKPDKKPISPVDGRRHGWTAPGFCVTAAEAIAYANSHPETHGIGLILSGGNISGGDLDHCVENGNPTATAAAILATASTYTELSPGLAGYRFLFFGNFGGHTGNRRQDGIEFYEDGRFLTFTGRKLPEAPATVERRDLADLGAEYFDKSQRDERQPTKVTFAHVDLRQLPISENARQRIREGAPKGERSEHLLGVACDLLRSRIGIETACCVLSDPENGISSKAHDERGSLRGAMDWTMKYVVKPAAEIIAKEQSKVENMFTQQQPHGQPASEDWPWEPPVDLYDTESAVVPPYPLNSLPPVYEAMMDVNFRFYNRASRELYAGLFMLSVAAHLRPSVQVEETPGGAEDRLFSINEQAGIVGSSHSAKTETLFHAVGMDGKHSVMKNWSDREQRAAAEKFRVRAEEIRRQYAGDESAIKAKINELKVDMPLPDITQSKITDKAFIATNSANDALDVPTNIIIDEWENVYGGASYRADGGASISDLHKKMYDNKPYADKTHGSGKIESDNVSGNIGFSATPADMATWQGYGLALQSGDMARKSLFAPGVKCPPEQRVEKLEVAAIEAWRAVQEKLHDLSNLTLRFERDLELEAVVDEEIGDWNRQADNGDYTVRWLAKTKIRMARLAASMFLVQQIQKGEKLTGVVVIPAKYRRKAWDFLTQFAWPHQVYVHNFLIAGEDYKVPLQIFLRRVMVSKLETVARDDLIGTKSSVSMRKAGEDFVKVLLNTYNWIRPRATRVAYNRMRPWEAGSFEVNPQLYATHEKYLDMILKEHDSAKGKVRKSMDKGEDW